MENLDVSTEDVSEVPFDWASRNPTKNFFKPVADVLKSISLDENTTTRTIIINDKNSLGSTFLPLTIEQIAEKRNAQIVIQGPVAHEMLLLFIIALPVLALGNEFELAQSVRHPIFFPYFLVSWLVYQVSRLIYYKNQLSLLPFYFSMIPAVLFIMLSREMHIINGILWFCSLMTIQMQSGVQSRKQVVFSTVVFAVCYLGTVYFMTKFYTDKDGTVDFKGLELNPPIDWRQEGLVVGCLLILGCANFYVLLKYIKEYSQAVAHREKSLLDVQEANIELRRVLVEMTEKESTNVDVDSPLTRVIEALQSIQKDTATSPDVHDQLEKVIRMLASNHSATDFVLRDNDEQMDKQTNEWLHDILQVKQTRRLSASGVVSFLKERTKKSLSTIDDDSSSKIAILHDLNFNAEICDMLRDVSSLDFDIFKFTTITNGRPLFYLSYWLFQDHDLINMFDISDLHLKNFLIRIEDGYHSCNPYHNSIHAADVLQFMKYLLSKCEMLECLSALDILAVIISCIIHDFDHPGINNTFLINTNDPLAITYNDKSVLENHHAASSFKILQSKDCDIFSNVNTTQYKQIREAIVTNVLATDAALHFDFLGKFKAKIAAADFDMQDEADRLMVTSFATKCSDMNNPSRTDILSGEWSQRIMYEFFLQGDEESIRQLPVSMFMDRKSTDVSKCQLGFIDFIVRPMFDAMNDFMDITDAVVNINKNRTKWARLTESKVDKDTSK